MNRSDPRAVDEMSKISDYAVFRVYKLLFYELADPRTNDWFLITSPLPGLSIIIAYHLFVWSWGPKHMRNRKPYELRKTLVVYNLLQVVLSTWIVYEGLDAAWARSYSWKCEPVDWSNSEEALRVAKGVYIYFLAKISELLDTVFFVLRKKEKQITFLHMYHHTVMPLISWGAVKYYPGGHGTFVGVINSFVHIIMYSYYLLAALVPQYQKYLWWKKYITNLQMIQFCLAFIHSSQLVFYDCGYPRWTAFFTLPNAVFFYLLFADFYNQAYDKKGRAKEKAVPSERLGGNSLANGINGLTIKGSLGSGKGKSD